MESAAIGQDESCLELPRGQPLAQRRSIRPNARKFAIILCKFSFIQRIMLFMIWGHGDDFIQASVGLNEDLSERSERSNHPCGLQITLQHQTNLQKILI